MSSVGWGEEAVCSCVLVLVLAREPVRPSTEEAKPFVCLVCGVVRSGSVSIARACLRDGGSMAISLGTSLFKWDSCY